LWVWVLGGGGSRRPGWQHMKAQCHDEGGNRQEVAHTHTDLAVLHLEQVRGLGKGVGLVWACMQQPGGGAWLFVLERAGQGEVEG
jgi:hypothetical protein